MNSKVKKVIELVLSVGGILMTFSLVQTDMLWKVWLVGLISVIAPTLLNIKINRRNKVLKAVKITVIVLSVIYFLAGCLFINLNIDLTIAKIVIMIFLELIGPAMKTIEIFE